MYKIKTSKIFFWNLQQMGKVTSPFCCHQNFVHKGLSAPTRGGERGGSVVECRTPEREVRGSRPTAAVLCPWARHFTPRKYWLITQEAMAPSRYDWKIVDWDVKPQHNQPTYPGLYTCGKTWKTCIKSDFKEIVLKLATNGQSDKGFLLTSTFVPKGLLSLPWGYIHV